MIIQSNQTVFDLAIMFEGNLDTLVNDVLINFGISNISQDNTGKQIVDKYTINNSTVKYFYDNDLQIETGDSQLFTEWAVDLGAFNNDYNLDFN
jgi:hypothetical protein